MLYGEYDASGALIREYVYLNAEPLAQITKSGSSEVLTYLHTDHLSTPRYGTDTAGVQSWIWNADAFGNGAPTGTNVYEVKSNGAARGRGVKIVVNSDGNDITVIEKSRNFK